jgi:hypothetical protein
MAADHFPGPVGSVGRTGSPELAEVSGVDGGRSPREGCRVGEDDSGVGWDVVEGSGEAEGSDVVEGSGTDDELGCDGSCSPGTSDDGSPVSRGTATTSVGGISVSLPSGCLRITLTVPSGSMLKTTKSSPRTPSTTSRTLRGITL